MRKSIKARSVVPICNTLIMRKSIKARSVVPICKALIMRKSIKARSVVLPIYDKQAGPICKKHV